VAGRVRALVWGLLVVAAAAGCEPEPEPRFSAACAPDGSLQRVTCAIRNHGKKASRACFRARLQPQTGEPVIARRVCTKVLGPEEGAEVPAMFERLGRVEAADLVSSVCAPDGRWACKVDVLETPREMAENQPRSR